MATSQLDLTSPNISNQVYITTNVNGWFFDATLSVDHQLSATLCDHPVAAGSDITDHVYINPRVLRMEIGMSDVATSYVGGQFNNSSSRSASAFGVLKDLMNDAKPLQIQTHYDTYTNMLIEDIDVHDDHTTQYGLRADVVFREIIVVSASEVRVTTTSSTSDGSTTASTTNQGQVQPTPTAVDANKQSALRSLTGRQLI